MEYADFCPVELFDVTQQFVSLAFFVLGNVKYDGEDHGLDFLIDDAKLSQSAVHGAVKLGIVPFVPVKAVKLHAQVNKVQSRTFANLNNALVVVMLVVGWMFARDNVPRSFVVRVETCGVWRVELEVAKLFVGAVKRHKGVDVAAFTQNSAPVFEGNGRIAEMFKTVGGYNGVKRPVINGREVLSVAVWQVPAPDG